MDSVLNYANEVTQAMALLAKHEKTLFVGQAVKFDGQRLHSTLKDVPMEKRIEMPVCEDFQVGFCTGLALEGFIPVSIFPRWDFLVIAANQILNHLDKIPLMGGFKPKVILRTAVGSRRPLDPGPQHTQDYSLPFSLMLKTMKVIELYNAEDVMPGYEKALDIPESVIVVEFMSQYR